MKSEKISACIGLLVMGLSLLIDPTTKSENFLKFFGLGIGLTLAYAVSVVIDGVIYLFKKPNL